MHIKGVPILNRRVEADVKSDELTLELAADEWASLSGGKQDLMASIEDDVVEEFLRQLTENEACDPQVVDILTKAFHGNGLPTAETLAQLISLATSEVAS